MLTGPKLGDALRKAIKLKGVTNAAVARHFGVKGPSVYDWINHGRIGKQHIDKLVAYFSDVVPPAHWGISAHGRGDMLAREGTGAAPPDLSADERAILDLYHGMAPDRRAAWAAAGRALAQPALKRGKQAQ